VAFSPDGRRVVSGGEDRVVTLWDLDHGRKEAVLTGHGTRVTGVSFSSDGAQLGSADQNGVIILWDIANRRPAAVFAPPVIKPNYCLLFSPNGRFLVSTPRIMTIDGRVLVDLTRQWMRGQVYGADFSDDGRFLATAVSDGWVAVWDGHTFRTLEKEKASNTHQITVSVSPDGKWLATGEDEGAVRLWSVNPLRQVAVLGRHTARVKSVAFSPDGATVASAGDDKMIALWDVDRRKLRTRVGTHASPIYSVAFSPDGRRLVSGEHDRSVRLYTRQRTLWGFRLE
jgi:WD40 repeat protein